MPHVPLTITSTTSVAVCQEEARVAFWCLSRQQLDHQMLQENCHNLVAAIALGLVTNNKWESMQCVQHSLKCMSKLSHQIPDALTAVAHLWLPQLWRLLLVQPVTEYEKARTQSQIVCCSLTLPAADACEAQPRY